MKLLKLTFARKDSYSENLKAAIRHLNRCTFQPERLDELNVGQSKVFSSGSRTAIVTRASFRTISVTYK